MRKLSLLVLPFLCASCSYLHSTTTRTPIQNSYSTNTVVQETTSVRVYTLFDGQANLTKFGNRSGYTTNGTFGPGTYVAGLNDASTSTNLVDIIGAVAAGIAKGLKP